MRAAGAGRTVALAAQLPNDKRQLAGERADVSELHFCGVWHVELGLHAECVLHKLRGELVAQPQEQSVAAVEKEGACERRQRQQRHVAAVAWLPV
jgi:hypothetical protein